ncbi:MAG: J domain-containing protein [Anaerolineaceae bacterium]|jgi:curved DNA-binding protein|nr:J domain-containing protein [Anaerolineaceae bacterium]HNZ15905.1 J domain-containing protein [Anaerolineaceae bacterium]HOF28125.1 J domain-containing protein [Anaerolineaceae bacterium]
MMDYKDYYKTLGVGKTATEDEIKTAYRKLARRYHPDVNKDPQAEEKFKEVNEAYQVLSDPEKRKKYDQFGSEWQRYQSSGGQPGGFDWGRWQQAPQGGQPGYRTVSQEEFDSMFGNLGGFSDFFNTLFGQGGFGARPAYSRSSRSAQTARPMEHEVELTLEEAYSGAKRVLQFEGGRKIEASIPPGVRTGSKVRLSGQAGGADLFLKIKVLPHKRFTRKGDDLITTVSVDIYTAILGGEVSVETMGKPVRLTIPEGTDSGKTMRLKGLGMPNLKNPTQYGDLYARVELRLPARLTPAEKEKFREIRNMRRA